MSIHNFFISKTLRTRIFFDVRVRNMQYCVTVTCFTYVTWCVTILHHCHDPQSLEVRVSAHVFLCQSWQCSPRSCTAPSARSRPGASNSPLSWRLSWALLQSTSLAASLSLHSLVLRQSPSTGRCSRCITRPLRESTLCYKFSTRNSFNNVALWIIYCKLSYAT